MLNEWEAVGESPQESYITLVQSKLAELRAAQQAAPDTPETPQATPEGAVMPEPRTPEYDALVADWAQRAFNEKLTGEELQTFIKDEMLRVYNAHDENFLIRVLEHVRQLEGAAQPPQRRRQGGRSLQNREADDAEQ